MKWTESKLHIFAPPSSGESTVSGQKSRRLHHFGVLLLTFYHNLAFRQIAPHVHDIAYDTLTAGYAARRLAAICALESVAAFRFLSLVIISTGGATTA